MSEETVANTMPSVCNTRLPRRVRLSDQQMEKITLEDLIHSWREQDLYIDVIEAQVSSLEAEVVTLRESEERIRQQHLESTHREKVLVRRLASKEQELQEYASQIAEFKAGQTAGVSAMRSALLDPAVNLLLQKLRGELAAMRSRLEETQNELSAWKFTPDSNTGKRLMAKCRLLYQENEELGRMISSGRLAKLEGELALQKSFSDEVKKSQSELDEFLQELDEDVEGMQSTIYYLQQELRKAKEENLALQQQINSNAAVAEAVPSGSERNSPITPVSKAEPSTSTKEASKPETEQQTSKPSSSASELSPPHQAEMKDGTEEAIEDLEEKTLQENASREEYSASEDTTAEEPIEDNAGTHSRLESEPTGPKHFGAVSEEIGVEEKGEEPAKDEPETSEHSETEEKPEGPAEPQERLTTERLCIDVDEQDSEGDLMIQEDSEVGEDANEETDAEDVEPVGPEDALKTSKAADEDEKVEEDRSVKRPAPETDPSDEDSDDAPLIKKVRRN